MSWNFIPYAFEDAAVLSESECTKIRDAGIALMPVQREAFLHVTQADLARLLFDSRRPVRELAMGRAELPSNLNLNDLDEQKLRRVLDIMWEGEEPELRKDAERVAKRVFDLARFREP
jgi:hypothetical protein